MGPIEAYTLILEQQWPGENISQAADWLAKQSREAVLLAPGVCVAYNDMPRVKGMERWPHWGCPPWIIAGRIERRKTEVRYDGPFIRDTNGNGYEEQVGRLLADFDWAMFAYFTTYHDWMISVVTTRHKLAVQLQRQHAVLGSYSGATPYLQHLPNATFYDYGEEGWLPFELARERGEDAPLILTLGWEEHPEYFCRYDDETGETEDRPWFLEPMSRLELVHEFPMPGHKGRMKLHRANDLDSYLALWSMASRAYNIAEATFSADCNIRKLEKLLDKSDGIDIIRNSGEVATWAYDQIYGGGADEHHAVFHSRDARATHRIWQMAGESGISRF